MNSFLGFQDRLKPMINKFDYLDIPIKRIDRNQIRRRNLPESL